MDKRDPSGLLEISVAASTPPAQERAERRTWSFMVRGIGRLPGVNGTQQ